MKGKLIFILFITLSFSDLFSQIRITEVMYNPTSPAKEWFEIYNSGPENINLQYWTWRDGSQSGTLRTITIRNLILHSNEYAVVCEDSVNLKQNFPGISGIILQSYGWSALNNSGYESEILYNFHIQLQMQD